MKKICILLSISCFILYPHLVQSQITGDDVFMKGLYTELGICKKGTFGSQGNAPAGYHPRTLSAFEPGTSLGFVCDVDMDGWTTGIPDFFGDYFTPGGAQEGWDIQLNNNWSWPDDPAGERWAKMWRHPSDGGAVTPTVVPATATEYLISGNNTDYYVSGRNKVTVWEGEMGNAGTTFRIGIRQVVTLDTIKRYFVIKVTFKPLSSFFGSPTFYYDRTVDPDNDRAFSSSYSTENTIINQPNTTSNKCLVTAEGSFHSDRNFLGLGTLDCRAKAYISNVSIFPPAPIKSIYESGTSSFIDVGDNIINDRGMGIIFKIPAMAFGDSTTISYAYVLSEDELDEALALTAPTVSTDGVSYADGDTLYICSFDSVNLNIENGNGLEWGEWIKSGAGTGITGPAITIFPESTPYTLSVIGTSSSCMSDTLRLVVSPDIRYHTIDTTICSGQVYTFSGSTYTSPVSGITDTFTTAAGCDSVVTLNLSFNPADTVVTNASICSGSSYTFFGTTYSSTGTYLHFDTVGIQCDTIRVLNLDVSPAIMHTIDTAICSGQALSFGGSTYTSPVSGITDTFTTAAGCDSVVTLNLSFNPADTVVTNASICSGSSYTFFGTTYSSTGTYLHFDTVGIQCDTIRVLNLDVSPAIMHTIDTAICSGQVYTFSGNTYTSPVSGITDTFTTAAGCDSVVILNLSFNPADTVVTNASICSGSSYTFFGNTYSSAGTYLHFDTVGIQCDTIRVLNLDVSPAIMHTIDTAICSGQVYTFSGNTYTSPVSGITDTFTTAAGCDSVVILNLSFNPADTVVTNASICSGSSYTFFGNTYSSAGTYLHFDTVGIQCDTIRILHLSEDLTYDITDTFIICNNELPSAYLGVTIPYGAVSDPDYSTVAFSTVSGCDSMITIHLIVLDSARTDIDTMLCSGSSMVYAGQVINTPGTYYDTQATSLGCDSIIALTVQYTEPPVSVDSFLTGCEEIIYEGHTFTENINFTDTFRNLYKCDSLYKNIHITILHPVYDTLDATICEGETYDFNGTLLNEEAIVTQTYTAVNGCDSFITLRLTVRPLPDITMAVESDDIICILDTVTLSVSGADRYTILDQFLRIIGEGEELSIRLTAAANKYYAIGTDEYGCSDTAEIVIHAESCCETLMPNAFSPNGDGRNDEFGPVSHGNPEDFKMQIFNRWGERIFTSYTIHDRWKGTDAAGNPVATGTYYYIVSGRCYDGTPLQFKGDLTLIR